MSSVNLHWLLLIAKLAASKEKKALKHRQSQSILKRVEIPVSIYSYPSSFTSHCLLWLYDLSGSRQVYMEEVLSATEYA